MIIFFMLIKIVGWFGIVFCYISDFSVTSYLEGVKLCNRQKCPDRVVFLLMHLHIELFSYYYIYYAVVILYTAGLFLFIVTVHSLICMWLCFLYLL